MPQIRIVMHEVRYCRSESGLLHVWKEIGSDEQTGWTAPDITSHMPLKMQVAATYVQPLIRARFLLLLKMRIISFGSAPLQPYTTYPLMRLHTTRLHRTLAERYNQPAVSSSCYTRSLFHSNPSPDQWERRTPKSTRVIFCTQIMILTSCASI